MTDAGPWTHPWPLRSLNTRRALDFDLQPDEAARARIARDLGLLDLPALRLTGTLRLAGRDEAILEARLVAHAIQPCSVTLVPVEARIDEKVRRHYLAELPEPAADEVEVPEDVDTELLPEVIDGGAVAVEALALALPAWPRAPDAELGLLAAAPPGVEPLRDEDLRPFAGLAGLKASLTDKDQQG